MNNKNNCSFSPADILIPKNIDSKWSVVACDQYTSEPEYWEDVKKICEGNLSTLDMILPECYLESDNSIRTESINKNMQFALDNDIFSEYKDSIVYLERIQSDGKIRKALIGKIDLTKYDYLPNSDAEIRATEKTVISRIPPRVEIRKNAPLELPHIMLLIDDPENTVIEPITKRANALEKIYDFSLMKNGGSVKGYLVNNELSNSIISALSTLKAQNDGLLFCVGDGNHSLATAKECYNLNKTEESKYALVEVVNIHDTALEFEPIYRVVFDVDTDKLLNSFIDYCGGEYFGEDKQEFTSITKNGTKQISLKPLSKLPVATLQAFLDEYLDDKEKIDYIHGEGSLKKVANKENAIGFIFEGMKKSDLFPAVRLDGSLPRKTFSMGLADDKRFYLEARKIR